MVQVGFDITLLMQVVQFLIIVLIVKTFIAGPIHRTYTARDEKIVKLQEEAKACYGSIEAKRLEYEEHLKAAKAEITVYHNKLKAEAAVKAQSIIDKVKAEIIAEKEAARKMIADETLKAKTSLDQESAELTNHIVRLVTK